VIHRLRKSTGIDDIDMENALGLLGDLNSGKIIISTLGTRTKIKSSGTRSCMTKKNLTDFSMRFSKIK
jgi:hypothetical protein